MVIVSNKETTVGDGVDKEATVNTMTNQRTEATAKDDNKGGDPGEHCDKLEQRPACSFHHYIYICKLIAHLVEENENQRVMRKSMFCVLSHPRAETMFLLRHQSNRLRLQPEERVCRTFQSDLPLPPSKASSRSQSTYLIVDCMPLLIRQIERGSLPDLMAYRLASPPYENSLNGVGLYRTKYHRFFR